MKKNVANTNHTREVESLMLQSRKDEKNFLARKDKKYLGKQMGHEYIAKMADTISNHADVCLKSFRSIIETTEKIKLDHKSDLQSKFSNIANILTKKMTGHEVDDLVIAQFQMYRYEKNYIKTKNETYKQQFLKAIETYKSILNKIWL